MCGIAGWVNFEKNIGESQDIINTMTETLKKRGPDDEGYFYSKNVLLGHRRLVVVDPAGGAQPMMKIQGGHKYVIVYNGELYNTEELRKILLEAGYSFDAYSDTEVLLASYMYWGIDCLKYINGIYAFGIWDEKEQRLFLARDPLGVKPLFYSQKGSSLIFGSEIKTILANPEIKPILTRDGLAELLSLGPARVPGRAVFKDIYEIPPANYMVFSREGIKLKEYWKPECMDYHESIEEAEEHVRSLLVDAIRRQLVGDVPVCTFLSGGLDSSLISAVASEDFKSRGKILNTFSINYEDDELYFKANEFEPTSDKYWSVKMSEFIGSSHHPIAENSIRLTEALYEAVLANDLPGMADVDSSLYLFCREVRKNATVALSGECADEIFGGYPWYRNPSYYNADTFPWSLYLSERSTLLAPQLKDLNISGFADEVYHDFLKTVPHIDGETPYEYRMRELFYLNIKWFMVTLLTRKDRMSMANSLEVRVPFADYRLVEYAFNIPPKIKFCDNREKGILRRASTGILPKEIVDRKKSPYPKTHNPEYTKYVRGWMSEIIKDKNAPILEIIDKDILNNLVRTGGESYKKPWFGQLMTGPQLLAYLIQLELWLKEYKIQLEL